MRKFSKFSLRFRIEPSQAVSGSNGGMPRRTVERLIPATSAKGARNNTSSQA
ncbi:hypothetical protein D3C71_2210900 [compost metagenome]